MSDPFAGLFTAEEEAKIAEVKEWPNREVHLRNKWRAHWPAAERRIDLLLKGVLGEYKRR